MSKAHSKSMTFNFWINCVFKNNNITKSVI